VEGKQPPIEPRALLLCAKKLGRVLGVSERHVWGMHASGQLGPLPVSLGRRKLWRRIEIEQWVAGGCEPRSRWLELQGASI
jgi:predicted DNA-binding transcriptional regulator AlpA